LPDRWRGVAGAGAGALTGYSPFHRLFTGVPCPVFDIETRSELFHSHPLLRMRVADASAIAVERREALGPTSLGSRAPKAATPGNRGPAVSAQTGRSQGPSKGVSQTPGASRRSIPVSGNGKRDHRRRPRLHQEGR
jgi:hypothetical protein